MLVRPVMDYIVFIPINSVAIKTMPIKAMVVIAKSCSKHTLAQKQRQEERERERERERDISIITINSSMKI